MRVDSAHGVVEATREQVYRAFVDPDLLVAWLPPSGMRGRLERFEAQTGGGFRMVLTYDDPAEVPGKFTADSDVSEVRFAELAPGHRVVWEVDFPSDDPALAGTMTMTWTFAAHGRGTSVEVVATGVPDGIDADAHAAGLRSSMENLARLLD